VITRAYVIRPYILFHGYAFGQVARHINIAHGLYPRDQVAATLLDRLAEHLRTAVSLSQGRTYAGGLVKFEPKEMERIPVPTWAMLTAGVAS